MAKTLLEQLREMTIVVADTGDIQAIEKFKPRDATTNPSLITAAAQMPQYQEIVDDTLKQAQKDAGPGAADQQILTLAFDRLAVAFGKRFSPSFQEEFPPRLMRVCPTTQRQRSIKPTISFLNTKARGFPAIEF